MALLGDEEFHREIALAAADLVNVIYEFYDDVDVMQGAMGEPLEALDELLVEGGYRPKGER